VDGYADGSVRIVGREVLDGRECVVLEMTSPISRMRVWVDVERGYAVPGGAILLREEVVESRQYGEGLWGPAKFTRVEYRPDGTVEKKVYGTYDPEFKINVPISENDLRPTLPSGTKVCDGPEGPSYTVP
jgi:hypothetical protein